MVAGADEEVLEARGLDAVLDGGIRHDHVVDRRLEVPGVDAEPGGRVPLRVEVDHQHPVVELGQGGTEVDRGRRLADATLLVGDGDHRGAGRRARGPCPRRCRTRRRLPRPNESVRTTPAAGPPRRRGREVAGGASVGARRRSRLRRSVPAPRRASASGTGPSRGRLHVATLGREHACGSSVRASGVASARISTFGVGAGSSVAPAGAGGGVGSKPVGGAWARSPRLSVGESASFGPDPETSVVDIAAPRLWARRHPCCRDSRSNPWRPRTRPGPPERGLRLFLPAKCAEEPASPALQIVPLGGHVAILSGAGAGTPILGQASRGGQGFPECNSMFHVKHLPRDSS